MTLSAAPLPLSLILALVLPLAAQAQVTVGYSNPIGASAARSRVAFLGLRRTKRFEVAGINVVPIDGSLVYDENTQWALLDPLATSSLSVVSVDPLLDLEQRDTVVDEARAQRLETVYAVVSGPLASTVPFNPRELVQPQELGLPALLLSVFDNVE